jgi:hypothetical protein
MRQGRGFHPYRRVTAADHAAGRVLPSTQYVAVGEHAMGKSTVVLELRG